MTPPEPAQSLTGDTTTDGTEPRGPNRPFYIGNQVIVTDHYSWCSRDVYGEVGEIVEINRYPEDIIEGGVIYSVRPPARIPIPLSARQIRHA